VLKSFLYDKANINVWKFDIELNFTKNEFKFILYELHCKTTGMRKILYWFSSKRLLIFVIQT